MIWARTLVWSEDEKQFAAVYLPYNEIKAAEEEVGGKLVTDPNLVRGLHRAFIRHMRLRGRPPDVVRCTIEPLRDFFFKRVSIKTSDGKFRATSTNLYFVKPRAIIMPN